ncbi:hypothetical protein CSQ96_12085 [Janthinobacterium sp. BJB412]|nr:hypothetical protein CSQ96_12085 [Janthinobacterium sp. BJB412]
MDDHNKIAATAGLKIRPLADALNELLVSHPDAPAAIQGDELRTYKQLSEAAQAVALQLLNAGITPGQRLALYLPRSIMLYETILGCLIAEVSFMSLPRGLDKSEQISEANRANCVGILSNEALFSSGGLAIGGIGHFWKSTEAIRPPAEPGETGVEVYCVRTSGTTGKPKVVPIHATQLTAFLDNSKSVMGISKHKRWIWMHDLSFDYSIWDTLGCLSHSGCLVILDEHMKHDARATLNLIANTGLNVLSVTPSELRYIFSRAHVDMSFDELSLSDIVIAGEKLSSSTLLPLFGELKRKGVHLTNAYGPSEATVFCLVHHISEEDTRQESIPIGSPLPGMVFELESASGLDEGELIIRGAQVFGGYDGGEPLTDGYRTGDICRRDRRGHFVFVGRSNGYQKVNGFRVEPYEIEEFLQSLPDVDEAVVSVENDSDIGDFLAAHIRVRPDGDLTTRDLRLACAKLAPYLRPSKYFLVENKDWPINERGKTDRMLLRRRGHEQR